MKTSAVKECTLSSSTSRSHLAVGALALALLASACNGTDARSTVQAQQATASPTASPTDGATTAPPVATATPTAAPTASPTRSPRPAPPSYDVKAVQTRLTALKYYVGAIDGERGAALRSAVMAFQ